MSTDGARTGRSEPEQVMCGLFAETLSLPAVGPDEDFFHLGGHSMLGARLISRVRRVFGASLGIRDLFEHPTAAALCGRLGGSMRDRPPLVRRPSPSRVPLAPMQRGLWFINQLSYVGGKYAVPVVLRVLGKLDRAALHRALTDVITRHEPLRTVFPQGEEPYQHVVPPEIWPDGLSVVDTIEAELEAAVHALVAQGIDLTSEPPLRGRLLRISANDHLLVLIIHHIAIDEWSVPVLMRELADAYTARVAGRAPSWPALAVRYQDFSLWQQDLAGSTNDPQSLAAQQLAFWREELAGLPEELSLPSDRPRPGSPTHRVGTVSFSVDPEVRKRLEDLAAAEHCTLFMVLQAALATTLTRLGAGNDIPIGVPVSGRTDEALNDMIGYFVNTVVVRVDTSARPAFREVLRRVRRASLAAYAHADVPFERLVEHVRPVRSASRHPLFQVLATHRTESPPTPDFAGLAVTELPIETPASEFDLMVEFRTPTRGDRAGAVEGTLTYSADLFDEPTASDLAQRLIRVLTQVVADVDRSIHDVELLGEDDWHRLLVAWNDTDAPLPDRTLPELFSEQVLRTPGREALRYEGTILTYGQLDERVARLARQLVNAGIGRGSIVAVLLPRSIELIVTLYAIHRAGAAYLPVDPGYPADRVAAMLTDAEPALVITPELIATFCADEDPAEVPLPAARLDDPAYVIYTSGSTGRPNGVVVSHAGIVNRLLWMQHEFQLTADDRVLQKTPSSFDVSVWEFFWPLMTGAVLVLARPEGHRDPAYLVNVITETHVTVAHFVPSMLEVFLAHRGAETCVSLRTVICSGEVLPRPLADRWAAGFPARLYNLYGPTEASVDVTSHEFGPDDPAGTVPIGRPVWNTKVFVLDDELRPVPPGVPGELYLAGIQLAIGYLRRPELTAERFLPAPPKLPATRLYRTGDLCRHRRDGLLEYLGRIDDQIKIRGFRIEPREIDNVILGYNRIIAAATVARTRGHSDKELISYVVPDRFGDVDPQAIRALVAEKLPNHMVPAVVVPLRELPLTPSGKVDRRALPAPSFTERDYGGAPTTERERRLCQVFADVLGLRVVGVDESFFDLGGHSLLAVRLIERVKDATGMDFSLRDLLESPTVGSIAARTGTAGAGNPLAPLMPLRITGDRRALFFFAPAAGVAWSYSALLSHLGDDRPVYGLQSPSLTRDGKPPTSFDEVVDEYLGLVRSVQPDGPYHLLGWSLGGVMAHGVATRLQDLGLKVGLLAMLDAYPPRPEEIADFGEDDPRWLAALLDSLGGGPGDPVSVITSLVGDRLYRRLDSDVISTLVKVFADNLRLVASARLTMFHGNVLFLRASADKMVGSPTPEEWAAHVDGDVHVVNVNCAHEAMLQPEQCAYIGSLIVSRLDV